MAMAHFVHSLVDDVAENDDDGNHDDGDDDVVNDDDGDRTNVMNALNSMVCFKSYLFRQVVSTLVTVAQKKLLRSFTETNFSWTPSSKLVKISGSTRLDPER